MPAGTAPAWRGPRPATDHSIQRPISRRPGFRQEVLLKNAKQNALRQPQIPLLRQEYEWGKAPELTIKLRNLPANIKTYDVYRNFKIHGTIVFIELYEGRNGSRDGGGKVRFSPPPKEAFWAKPGFEKRYEMRSENGHRRYICGVEPDIRPNKNFKIRSPVNKSIEYDQKMALIPWSLHFGIMLSPDSFMAMESINASPGSPLTFTLDLFRNRLVASFIVDFKDPRSQGDIHYVSKSRISEYERKNKYMFQIPFNQLQKIYRVDLDASKVALVISLESPPSFYRRVEDEQSGHSDEGLVWSEFDSWKRAANN
jgi:RNA-dependent RNA polymerase